MGVDVVVLRAAARTTTGTQNFTSSGFGTPKAAIFTVTSGITDGTAAADFAISTGATDGTNQIVASTFSQDNVSTTVNKRRGATDEVILLLSGSGGTSKDEANFTSWITDGVQITWGTRNTSTAWLVTCTLITGSDFSANVGQCAATNGSTVDVDCGFEPDSVFFFGHGTGFADSLLSTAPANYGFALNEATIINRAMSYASNNNVAASWVSTWMSEQRCVVNPDPAQSTTPTISRSFYVSDFITGATDGFEITHVSGNNSADLISAYFAMAFGGAVDVKVGSMDTPTSTGNDPQTGPGFTPQFVMTLMGPLESVNAGSQEGTFGVSLVTADEEFSNSAQDEDAQGTTDTQSIADDTAVNLPLETGAAGHVAAFVSMDATGWTYNFTTTTGTAKKWPWLAIEEVAAAGGAIGPFPTFRPVIS